MIKNLQVEILEKVEKTIVITIRKRFMSFHFVNGVIYKVESNLPYQKSLEDWDFYALAIETMRTQSRKWAKNK